MNKLKKRLKKLSKDNILKVCRKMKVKCTNKDTKKTIIVKLLYPKKNSSLSVTEEVKSLGDLKSYRKPENILGIAGKEGTTYLVHSTVTGKDYAMKTFRSTKSAAKIAKEVELQNKAASLGVSPKILTYSGTDKYILMEKLPHRLIDIAKNKQGKKLTKEQQKDIIDCAHKLDSLDILHNDGNVLNLMTDDEGKVYMIDYGFAKKISKKILKKYGPKVNGSLTVASLVRSLRHNSIKAKDLEDYVVVSKKLRK